MASASAKRRGPPSSRRRVPIAATAPGSAQAAAVSPTAVVSTGWQLASTKRLVPPSIRARTACSKKTGWRIASYQYSGPSSRPSSGAAFIAEKNGTSPARG